MWLKDVLNEHRPLSYREKKGTLRLVFGESPGRMKPFLAHALVVGAGGCPMPDSEITAVAKHTVAT